MNKLFTKTKKKNIKGLKKSENKETLTLKNTI